MPCVLVQCIWPQRAKQNPRQLSPIASGKNQRRTSYAKLSTISVHFQSGLSIPAPSPLEKLPGQLCFQVSHLTRRPPQTHPKGTNTFLERHRCLEGCPKPLQEIGGTEANFLALFSSRCCLCRYLCPREGINSARRWAAGEWPSVNNQFHVNLLELQVRRAHLQGAPLPSIHKGAASTNSWKQSRDAEEKISSVCLEMSPGYPEDLVGGSGLHLYLMFTKHPFLSSVRDRPCLSLSAQFHD